VDISREYLDACVRAVGHAYPGLSIVPVCADYTRPFALPPGGARSTLVFFPGSTIGNFEPAAAVRFLAVLGEICRPTGGILIGVDLKKDRARLERAYDDPERVTAAFNLNLLGRINRELGANFDLGRFRHRAFYDAEHGRIEMQLVSTEAQVVCVSGMEHTFFADEPITTEYSYKYDPDEFADLAGRAGLQQKSLWTDAERLFSVQHLVPC
jgi:dimethylhistidine N-methyltransferase